ncbi:MAG: polysaccharide deacetylase family protein [Vicinamibacterales bacterium]
MIPSWRKIAERTLPLEPLFGWRVRSRRLPGVAVLCYHGVRRDDSVRMAFETIHVTAATLDAHCRVLARDCDPISLDDWRRYARGESELPARPVLVTFDDGYRSVLTEAVPVLERHGVPAVVFVATGAVARGQKFWYDAMAAERGEDAVEAAKDLPHDEWMMRVSRLDRTVAADDPHAPLLPEEVGRLSTNPLIEVGGHTSEHPILARASRVIQQAEIGRCAADVRRWTGRPMRAFAYPNGRPGRDFTAETRDLVHDAGVDHAFSTEPGIAPADGDALAHPRHVMTEAVSASVLLHRLWRRWE